MDYKSFLKDYEGGQNQSLRQAEEVIHIDIVRSFKKHGEYNQEELKSILKAYAAFDKEVSYCQGMNYIMGFFYLHERDAELSFKSFVKLMEKHMKTMFDKDFNQLKTNFFKLNRLVDIYLPDLSEHFKVEFKGVFSFLTFFRMRRLMLVFMLLHGLLQLSAAHSNFLQNPSYLKKSGTSSFW